MGDMPSARAHALLDLRRRRAGVAALAVLLVSGVALFATTRVELFALLAAALLAYLAVPSWVGVAPRFPVPSLGREMVDRLVGFAVPAIGAMLLYTVWTKGRVEQLSAVPVLLVGAAAFAVYRWRYLNAALEQVRGEGRGMPFLARLWRHYLGYVTALAVGLGAAFALGAAQVMFALVAFGSAFFVVKLAIDFALPQPPLAPRPLSATMLTLALMSPIWFAVPWGASVTVALALMETTAETALADALSANAMVAVYVGVATVAVFAALTVVALVMELATGEG